MDKFRTLADLGEAVRARRKADGHKAVDIAQHSGRSRDVLHRLENGQDVTTAQLIDILRAMGLGLRLEPLGMPTLEEMAQRFYKELIPRYMLRHKVKPGITGWAQVNGFRGETETVDKMKARVDHDLVYLESWSVWLDLKIVLMTVFKGFFDRNAY